MRQKIVEVFAVQKGKVRIFADFLPRAVIVLSHPINTDFAAKLPRIVKPPRHADGAYGREIRVMQKGVGVMDSAVDGKIFDVVAVWFVFGGAVFDLAVFVKLDQFVLVAFVFDKHGISVHIAAGYD